MAEHGEKLMKYHKADNEDVKEQQPSGSSSSGVIVGSQPEPPGCTKKNTSTGLMKKQEKGRMERGEE